MAFKLPLILAICLTAAGASAKSDGPRSVDGFPEVVDSNVVRIDANAVRLKGIAVPKASTPDGLNARGWLHRRIQNRRTYCHFEPNPAVTLNIGTCEIEGLDLSALMVEAGVALDCPKESGGRYRVQQGRAEAAGQRLADRFQLPDNCKTAGGKLKRGG
ncbi:thermonuclease family protein [Lacibacterium aquatile]|uniref:Thermonuclease family protein n=1 Tax=Lacibacterium aquatile TaxID=1168082 RepID=A0ABW5DNI1_9PROT